jgi:hypothetical protein
MMSAIVMAFFLALSLPLTWGAVQKEKTAPKFDVRRAGRRSGHDLGQ